MASYTTHVRMPVARWRESPDVDELIMATERKVRGALRGADSDPDAEVRLWWYVIIPGADLTAHEGSTQAAPYGRGELSITWRPGETIPDEAEEIVCRGATVT